MGNCCTTLPKEHSREYAAVPNTESMSNLKRPKPSKQSKKAIIKAEKAEKCEITIESDSGSAEYDESNTSDQFIKVHVDEDIIRPIDRTYTNFKEVKYAQSNHCGSKSPSKTNLSRQGSSHNNNYDSDKLNGRTQTVQSFDDSLSKASTSSNIHHQIKSDHVVFDKIFNGIEVQMSKKQNIKCSNDQKDKEEDLEIEVGSPSNHRKKSRHSVCTSYKIIDEYNGDQSILRMKKEYLKLSKTKSTHSVKRSKRIIGKYKNRELAKLKKKYKKNRIKTHETKEEENENENENENGKRVCSLNRKRTKSTHDIKRSSIIIGEYKGNETIKVLKSKYMKQYRQKQREALNYSIPPKPTNIGRFMTEEIDILHNELCEYMNGDTHYIGMAEFDNNIEVCIELKVASNVNGVLSGKRTSICNGNEIDGKGKIMKDVIWSPESKKYEGCIKFEWTDKDKKENDLVTKLVFDTKTNYFDIDHLYFEGQCFRYFDDGNVERGCFNMVCVSMRKRNFEKRNGLLQYHEVDIWSMSDEELRNLPKYIKCMNITSVKMNQCFDDNNTTALSLFS